MKKNDIILMVIVLLIGSVAFFGMKVVQNANKSSSEVLIKHEGVIIKTIPFDETTDETFTFNDGEHYNLIVIKDGKAFVQEADCRDQICVKTNPIALNGEIIVCLPNKITVEVFSEEKQDGGLDSIAD